MDEKEPKRNILVESDDVSTRFPLQIDVVGYVAFARGLWMNRYCLRALVMLMQGLRGLNFDVAIKILEGEADARWSASKHQSRGGQYFWAPNYR